MVIATACASSPCVAQVDLTIRIEGDCPGRITMTWEGATPDRYAGLCFSQSLGQVTLPDPLCAGTVLGLGTRGLRLLRWFEVGPEGMGETTGRAAPLACGGYLQMLVNGYPRCQTSNVVQLPE